MWAEYLHHVTVHFPLVLSIALAGVGLWSLHTDPTDQLDPVIRWGGWGAFALACVAVVSGVITAPGWFGGDGSVGLRHHRDLGLTSLSVFAFAAYTFETFARGGHRDWRRVAIGAWCVAAFSTIGTAHWGGSELHRDTVPWLEDEQPSREAAEPPSEDDR